MEGEIQEWEVVQSSGSAAEEDNNSNNNSNNNNKLQSFEEMGDVTQGMISFDYFSLENRVEVVDKRSEDGSVLSGSPGWIEPLSDATYGPKYCSELWSDSSSDRVEDQRLVDDIDENNELGFETSVDIDEYSGSTIGRDKKDCLDSDEGIERKAECLLSGEVISGDDPLVGEEKSVRSGGGGGGAGGGGGGEEKGFVWWKIPIELVKYCVFRVNPIWSFSMAAAVVGFVMLGRRLYNMKKKTRSLQLKVLLLDDKRVANHAARWNEAISVVKRVPIIRPTLPSSVGMYQWSMLSLR